MSSPKAVILAGGYGTRLSEETLLKPKPMVEIGEQPILWHIMKHLSGFGLEDFIICAGYKSRQIKEFFFSYRFFQSDVTFTLDSSKIEIHSKQSEPWKVTIVDSGVEAGTGGRLLAAAPYLTKEAFLLTYGDGLGDIDIKKLLSFHRDHGGLATVTAVQPKGRYGKLEIHQDKVTRFREKKDMDQSWINAGYFVLEPEILKFIKGSATAWENEPLEELSKKGELFAFKHHDFWQSMDTLRDKKILEELWNSGLAPWKNW